MAEFDFIQGDDFRLSLESDYKELNSAIQTKAWKAVYILAGSILEAILVDYLVTIQPDKKLSSDLAHLSLGRAISECRKEGVISERTEHLTHVIQSYRNLIHPGRSVRLGEVPSENGAKIVYALIDIIVEEISARRKQNYGFTAEQVVAKLENDPTAIGILQHLLNDTNEFEKERLLLEVLPKRYSDLLEKNDEISELMTSLVTCFRMSFYSVSDAIKKKVSKDFVKILKEEKSSVAWRYVFFRMSDLQYFLPQEDALIKQHFLSILKAPLSDHNLQVMEGIGALLKLNEIESFLYLFINSLAIYEDHYIFTSGYSANKVFQTLVSEYYKMNEQVRQKIEHTLKKEYFEDIKDESHNRLATVEKEIYLKIFGINLENYHRTPIEPSDLENLFGNLDDDTLGDTDNSYNPFSELENDVF